MKRSRRGQSLVLFSLTLMLLALMVLLTISMGMRVREKMELQTLADAAAYSNAVATARTYNVMAVMNRTEWSLLVAQTATQAYISWATAYYDALLGLRDKGHPLMAAELLVCPNPTQIPAAQLELVNWRKKLDDEIKRIEDIWQDVDRAASQQVQSINGLEAAMNEPDFLQNYETLEALVRGQKLTAAIVSRAQPASIWPLAAPDLDGEGEDSSVNMREINKRCKVGAACDPMPSRSPEGPNNIIHQYEIYMGSRGDAFTTSRAGGAGTITARLNLLFAGYGFAAYGGDGSAYRSDQHDSPRHNREANPGAAQSDDHGSVLYTGLFAGCPAVGGASVRTNVLANLSKNHDDRHQWSNGTGKCKDEDHISHTLIGDIAGGNWPIVIDYNENKLDDGDDLQGQPKLYALITRDYGNPGGGGAGGKEPPYFLHFNFNFAPGLSSRFDNRGLSTRNGAYDISKQAALAAGWAYYHRGGQWAEPPNFMNPFWRATLVKPDIDAQGKGKGKGKGKTSDIVKTLDQAGLDVARQAYQALDDAKFEGW